MKRLEFTRFSHKNPLYTPLNGGSTAVVSIDIAFDNSNKIMLIRRGDDSLHLQQKVSTRR